MPYGDPVLDMGADSGRLTLLLPGIDDFTSLHDRAVAEGLAGACGDLMRGRYFGG
jgi:hypothetical protein